MTAQPAYRSILAVPASSIRFMEKAAQGPADSIFLTRLDNATGLALTSDPGYKPPASPGYALEKGHKEGPYIHLRDNPAGPTRDLWYHDPCGAWIVAERNTVTHAFTSTTLTAEVSR